MRRAVTIACLATFVSLPAHALVWPDVPDRVERGLGSPDPASRRIAARELSTLSPARGGPLVVRALEDADPEVRLAAAQSAIRLHVSGATDVAMPWLGERDARLRAAACEIALAMPSPRLVPALARALGDSDPAVRATCANALGGQGSPDAVAPLSGKLDDPTPNVRSEVARALARVGDGRAVVPLVGKVQDSVPDVRQAVVRALGDLGDPRATQALLLALRDNVPEVKVEALASLGRLHAPEAVDAIAPLALERNPVVRQAALVALGRIATPSAVRALLRAMGTQDDATGTLERTPVRDALVAAGAPAVIELTALLERPVPPAVATSAAWVLGELRATKSAPTLVAALRRGTLPPAAALRALAGAGGPESVPIVLEFLSFASPVEREQALRAAAALLDPARPDGRAVEPLAAALKNPRTAPGERAQIATLLGRTGAPRAAAELSGLLSSKDAPLRLAAIDALGALGAASETSAAGVADDTLVPLLGDPDAGVRLHASVALGANGGVKARGALLKRLDGEDEFDRYAVLTALGGIQGRLPDAETANRLFAELEVAAGPERDAVIEAAGRARLPDVVQKLAAVAEASDPDDRRAVAGVLAAHKGSADAAALLRKLANDADTSVAARAAFSLGAVGSPATVPALVLLCKKGDVDVATNAAAAIARIAAVAGKTSAEPLSGALCPMLTDGRPTVRANALVGLALLGVRCGDGRIERKILLEDPVELARAAAARAVVASKTPDDKAALERCAAADRSAEVARACRGISMPRTAAAKKPQAVTVYVVGETGVTAKPKVRFLLEYADGILRSGVADRRGATFDPVAAPGDVVLRRMP